MPRLDPHIALVDDGGERAGDQRQHLRDPARPRTPDGELIPGLATDLPTQVDDTTWEFTLREGVTFHDGTPFNADAVVASVEPHRSRFIEEGQDRQRRLLRERSPVRRGRRRVHGPASRRLLPRRCPAVAYVLAQDHRRPRPTESSDDLSDAPVGTGPYKSSSSESPGCGHRRSTANAEYWDGAPSISSGHGTSSPMTRRPVSPVCSSGNYDLITNLAPAGRRSSAGRSLTAQGQEHPILILDADDGITSRSRTCASRSTWRSTSRPSSTTSSVASPTIDNGQLLSPSILGHNADLAPYPYDPEEATAPAGGRRRGR
jgi:peptide/nickel transport system substrate-binding protein